MLSANFFMTFIRSRSRSNAQHYHFLSLYVMFRRDKCIQFYKNSHLMLKIRKNEESFASILRVFAVLFQLQSNEIRP